MDFRIKVLSQDGQKFNVTVNDVEYKASPRSGSLTSHIINLKKDSPVQNLTIKSDLLIVGATIVKTIDDSKIGQSKASTPRVKTENNVFRALLDVDDDGSLTLGYVINKKVVKLRTLTNKALSDAFALIKNARSLVSEKLTSDVVATLNDYNTKIAAIESAKAQGFSPVIIKAMQDEVTAPAGLDDILKALNKPTKK